MRVTEILGRSEQGATLPFLCRAEDGDIYYVKGRFAGNWALCCEWIAGELANRIGLPIAPFSILVTPPPLIAGSLRIDAEDLGSGFCFGSRQVPRCRELTWRELEREIISTDLRARILVFDWWIANGDRQLSNLGGNPNLLWTEADLRLHLIDHNLAFHFGENAETLESFAGNHIFGTLVSGSDSQDANAIDHAMTHVRNFWMENRSVFMEVWEALPDQWTELLPGSTFDTLQDYLDRIVDI